VITVDLSLNLHTALHCPNAVRPHDTKRSESETDSYEPNQAKDSSHETTGDPNEKAAPFLETESFSITQANIYQHKEENTEDSNITVNAIALFKCKLSRSILHLVTEEEPETKSSMIQTISRVITEELISRAERGGRSPCSTSWKVLLKKRPPK
jgi:hypothetical protein